MDGNLLARRIVAIAVKEKANVNGSKGFFFPQIFYWLHSICCAICADRVQSGLHEFLDPWRPLLVCSVQCWSVVSSCSLAVIDSECVCVCVFVQEGIPILWLMVFTLVGGASLCGAAALVLLIISTATDFWMQYRYSGNAANQGLWRFCINHKCQAHTLTVGECGYTTVNSVGELWRHFVCWSAVSYETGSLDKKPIGFFHRLLDYRKK